MPKNCTVLYVTIPVLLKRAVRIRAAELGLTMQDVTLLALYDYLAVPEEAAV